MVMTRPTNGTAATDAHDAPPRRVVARSHGMPGSRAVVGGVFIALAGLGTFLSWQRATGTPQHSYAVATRTLQPGDPLTAEDVRFEPIDLPAGVSGGAFRTAGDLEGRVLVAPVGEGELFQRGSLSDQGQPDPAAEVSVALERELAVDGRLSPGDVVDVYATHDEETRSVAQGLRVISVTEGGGAFDDGSELTVTLALSDPGQQVPVIHAARAGEVTLVRTTHVPRSSSSTGAVPPADPAPTGTTVAGGATAPGGQRLPGPGPTDAGSGG